MKTAKSLLYGDYALGDPKAYKDSLRLNNLQLTIFPQT